VNDEKLTR